MKHFFQFLLSIHFHLVVLVSVMLTGVGNTNAMYQYLAAYTIVVLLSVLLIFIKESKKEKEKGIRFIGKITGVTIFFLAMFFMFVFYFYIEARTDMYALVVYAGGLTIVENLGLLRQIPRRYLGSETMPNVFLHFVAGLTVVSVYTLMEAYIFFDDYFFALILTVSFALQYIWFEMIFFLTETVSAKIGFVLLLPFFLLGTLSFLVSRFLCLFSASLTCV